MKNILLIFFIIFYQYACKNNSNESIVNNKASLLIRGYRVLLSEYQFKLGKERIKWFYPYQCIAEFRLINFSKDTMYFILDNRPYRDSLYGEMHLELNNKSYNVISNTRRIITPGDSIIFFSVIVNFPLFVEAHSKSKFKEKFNYLVKNSKYILKFINTDSDSYDNLYTDKIRLNTNKIRYDSLIAFKKTENFDVIIMHNAKQLSIDDVGFPTDSIPRSVEIFRLLDGVDY